MTDRHNHLPFVLWVLSAALTLHSQLNAVAFTFTKLKDLHLTTALVADGVSQCELLRPEGKEYEPVADRIRSRFQELTGAEVTVTTRLEDIDLKKVHVIALGQMTNNLLVTRLYWGHYCPVDSLTPGPGKGLLATVCNPYPWTSGHNVVVVGGSDRAGVEKAAEMLLSRLQVNGRSVTLSYTYDVQPRTPITDELKKRILDNPDITFNGFMYQADSFLQTGQPEYAEAARKILLTLADQYDADPKKDITYAEECWAFKTLADWDAIEENPVFSDADRLRITNLLYNHLLLGLPARSYEWGYLEKGERLCWNHTTWPLMGIYYGARYFRAGYPEVAEQMDDWLKRCANGFRPQFHSYKPREDANHYWKQTILSCIEYSLAEWDLTFFENGNMRQAAEYAIATSDSTGGEAQWGDSEGIHTTAAEEYILSMAFWWTRDPQYLWRLNFLRNGKWLNPYDQSINQEPLVRPAITVMPLTDALYNFEQQFGSYSGPRNINVPLARTFDKLALRNGFKRTDQYLLIDGFGSGMHLHRDANMIVRLTDRGRVWLIDDDYLLQSTTEHSGISVVRDGRAKEVMPVCASLDLKADLGGCAFTKTTLSNYNGIDWARNILWSKGNYFVTIDRARAREDGDFAITDVWKVYDSGDETLVKENGHNASGAGISLVCRQRSLNQGGAVLPDATFTIACPDSEARAKTTTRRSTSSDLPSMRLHERINRPLKKGESVTFHNLLFSGDTVDDRQLSTCRIKGRGDFLLISGTRTVRPMPVNLAAGKPYTFSEPPSERYADVTGKMLTDNYFGSFDVMDGWVAWYLKSPDVTVDFGKRETLSSISVTTLGGNVWGVRFPASIRLSISEEGLNFSEVESLPVTEPESGAFKIKTFTFDLKGRTLRYARMHIETQPGAFTFLSEITAAAPPRTTQATTTQIAALAGLGDLNYKGLTLRAEMAHLTPTIFSLVNGTELSWRGFNFHSDKPVSVEFDLHTGKGLVDTAGEARFKICGTNLEVKSGAREFAIAGWKFDWSESEARFKDLLAWAKPRSLHRNMEIGAKESQPLPMPQAKPANGVPTSSPRWSWHAPQNARVNAIRLAVMHPGEGPSTLIAAGNNLICLDASGKERWRFTAKDTMRCVDAADLDGDGVLEVLCGSNDHCVYALRADGSLLWKHEIDLLVIAWAGWNGNPQVELVKGADVNGDGKAEVIAATNNSHAVLLDSNGKRLWDYGFVYHGPRKCEVLDVDGDGKQDILIANRYGGVSWLRPDGTPVTGFGTEIGDATFDVGPLSRDGKNLLVAGSSTGALIAYRLNGQAAWRFDNYGYGARAIKMVDFGKDIGWIALVGSETGYLYALDAQGALKWQHNFGDTVSSIAVSPISLSTVFVGVEDGNVWQVSASGKLMRRFQASGAVGDVQAQETCLLVSTPTEVQGFDLRGSLR